MFDAATVLKQPCGRPSGFTSEIADQILQRLSEGESLRSICCNDDMPGQTTVFRWLSENAEFRERYARAREAQAEVYVDEIISISDSVAGCADNAMVQAARLRVDARKWIAAKLLPKKYGDRLGLENSGSVVVKVVTGLGDE